MENSILQFFEYKHLADRLADFGKPFGELARHLAETLPDGRQKDLALQDLLRSKDAAVRSVIATKGACQGCDLSEEEVVMDEKEMEQRFMGMMQEALDKAATAGRGPDMRTCGDCKWWIRDELVMHGCMRPCGKAHQPPADGEWSIPMMLASEGHAAVFTNQDYGCNQWCEVEERDN